MESWTDEKVMEFVFHIYWDSHAITKEKGQYIIKNHKEGQVPFKEVLEEWKNKNLKA
jgi:hypothetical protein